MGFDVDLIDRGTGYAELLVSGSPDALQRVQREAGGHRWQRVPPTERKGRVHTSTVTVAVLPVPESSGSELRQADLQIETMRGSGAGGQHRNVTESAVRIRHLPTGLEAYCCSGRNQHQNKAGALQVLSARIMEKDRATAISRTGAERKAQIGSGQRGDKVRTYRVRDDLVTDHRTGDRYRLSKVRKGDFSS